MIKFQNHAQYDKTIADVKRQRHAIEGEDEIKRHTYLYLKHPDMIDTESPEAIRRYSAYIDGAEFDDYPADTERTMLGQMLSGKPNIELPTKLGYLEENIDGDGMSMIGMAELVYKNLAEVKFHILVAEMDSLQSVEIDKVSVADVEKMNLKATVKSYTRESLVDWEFERINGVMQISMLMLEEISTVLNKITFEKKETTSRLVLALDSEGYYYQRKLVKGGDNSVIQEGKDVYPLVGGERLKWIPAEIVVDEETPAGVIPKAVGYLRGVVMSTLYRYQVSADEKEALRHMQPTTFTSGWKQGDHDLFKEINGGREYIAFGVGIANNMPDGVTADIKGLGVEIDPFYKYYERNDKKLQSFGANVNTGDGNQTKTATQAANEASKRVAIMTSIANNTEAALKRIVAYCGMFMGLCKPDDVETFMSTFEFALPREFSAVSLSPEEVGQVINLVNSSLISKDEGIRLLVDGGATVSTAQEILDELEMQGPDPVPLPRIQQEDTESQQ